eukprot:49922_1
MNEIEEIKPDSQHIIEGNCLYYMKNNKYVSYDKESLYCLQIDDKSKCGLCRFEFIEFDNEKQTYSIDVDGTGGSHLGFHERDTFVGNMVKINRGNLCRWQLIPEVDNEMCFKIKCYALYNLKDGLIFKGWISYQKNGKNWNELVNDKQHASVYKLEKIKEKGKYEGERNNEGKRHGKGKYEYNMASGLVKIYEGDWRNGKEHGKGVLTIHQKFPKVYDGDWVNGCRDGQGTQTQSATQKYEGGWKNNTRHGKGKFTYDDGTVYDGDWVRGQQHGECKFTYADGAVYEGGWKDGKKHGKGKYTWAPSESSPEKKNFYDGEWKDDEKHGEGYMRHYLGSEYNGHYKNDRKHGKGTLKTKNGSYDGGWFNGYQA